MILVVLALVWAVALTPMVLRKLAERRSSYSVDRFHHSLHAIQFGGSAVGVSPDARVANKASVSAVRGTRRPANPFWPGAPMQRDNSRDWVPESSGHLPGRREAHTRVSTFTAMRRRQVLATLVGTLFGALLLGFVPGMQFFWDLAIVAFVACAAYIALLVYFRRLAIERSQKVIYIAPPRPLPVRSFVQPTPVRPRAAALVAGG